MSNDETQAAHRPLLKRSFSPDLSFEELCRPVGGRETSTGFLRRESANSSASTGDISNAAVGSLSTGRGAALAVSRMNKAKKPVSKRIG